MKAEKEVTTTTYAIRDRPARLLLPFLSVVIDNKTGLVLYINIVECVGEMRIIIRKEAQP